MELRDSGWEEDACMPACRSKPLPESKATELAEIMKEFVLAESLFIVLDEQVNMFTKWLQHLRISIDGKFRVVVQQCERCISMLDFRSFYTCMGLMESLQWVPSIEDEVARRISDLNSEMSSKIDSLRDDIERAIENCEFRRIDKVFQGLGRGVDQGCVAGKHLDDEYEALQTLLEHKLRTLCATIQSSLDSYEIKDAHFALEKFRSLLVSETVQRTEFNEVCRKRFQDEIDEIKKEILTPRRLREDPTMICRCLEGFKQVPQHKRIHAWCMYSVVCIHVCIHAQMNTCMQAWVRTECEQVDNRFYKRQRDQFLDQLKGELELLGEHLTKQDVHAVKNLQQRLRDLKQYEVALEGQGCDDEIKGYKQQVFESLVETMLTAHDEIEANVAQRRWDGIEQSHKFLAKAIGALRTSGWVDEQKESCIAKFEELCAMLEQKGDDINSGSSACVSCGVSCTCNYSCELICIRVHFTDVCVSMCMH